MYIHVIAFCDSCKFTLNFSPTPDVGDWYRWTSVGIGAVHVLFSLFVLITYILSNRPRAPDFSSWRLGYFKFFVVWEEVFWLISV